LIGGDTIGLTNIIWIGFDVILERTLNLTQHYKFRF